MYQLVINGLIAGSLAALIAGGLALVYGTLGIFNLALGQMVLVGGYITWWLHQSLGLPLYASIIGGIIGGTIVTYLIFELFVKPFYRNHRFLPLVTTIALSMILDGILLLLFGSSPKSIIPGTKHIMHIANVYLSIEQIIMVLLTAAILCAFAYVLHSTSMGRKIRAVVQNEHAAMSLGIKAPLLHLCIFLVSGIFATLGGIYIGIDTNLSPTLGFAITIKAYAAIIAGGKGNFWGAIACAYLIAFLEQFFVGIRWFGLFYIPAGYQQTVALLFIILFLLLRPQGLFSTANRTD